MNFSKNIKELREQFHFTQTDISEKLGITQTAYSKYERGLSRPEYENLVKLARLYDVSVDFLLDNE